jgi:hypothetical protein
MDTGRDHHSAANQASALIDHDALTADRAARAQQFASVATKSTQAVSFATGYACGLPAQRGINDWHQSQVIWHGRIPP